MGHRERLLGLHIGILAQEVGQSHVCTGAGCGQTLPLQQGAPQEEAPPLMKHAHLCWKRFLKPA